MSDSKRRLRGRAPSDARNGALDVIDEARTDQQPDEEIPGYGEGARLDDGATVQAATAEASNPPSRKEGSFRRTLRQASEWRELRRTPYGLQPVLILGSISFIAFFSNIMFRVATPEITRDLDISLSGIIGVVTIFGFFAVFAGIAAGWYADRHRRIPFVGLGAIGSGLFSALTGGATSTFTLGAARVGDTLAEEAASVPRFALIADYYPPEARGRVFALLGIMRNLPEVGAPLLVGLAVVTLGWRAMYVITGIPLMLMGVVAWIRLREPIRGYFERKAVGADEETARTEDEPQSLGEAWRTVWSVRTLRRFFMANIFFNFLAGATGLFTVFFLAERYGLNAFERGLVATPIAVSLVAGGFLGGGLVDSLTRRNPGRVLSVYGAFALFSVVGAIGYALQPPLWILVVFGCLVGFGRALVGPAASAVYSQVIPPQVRVQGLQMTGLAAVPAFVIGFPLGGLIFTEYGYRTLFLAEIPFLLIGAILAASAGSFFDGDRRNAFAAAVAAQEWREAKASGTGKLLVCRNVDVEYSGVQVLFDVDFDVEEGEIIALLGTNGAGKSTLLRAISGSTEAANGAIVFDGRDITHMPPHEIAARGVIHMPGGRGVFPGLSVRENLLLGNWLIHDEEEVRARLEEVFEIFPALRERADSIASNLSGGEQQQLSLAQAFLAKPRLLMIDELSLGLAPAVVGELIEIVREIHRRGTTIVVVEQSVNVALTLAEKAIFMEKGEVKFFGRTKDLMARSDILRAVYVKGSGSVSQGAPASARRSEKDRRALELEEARPVLEVEGLTRRFGGITAVHDVSFGLREGEVLGLIGPNGAGKTTLFEMIGGYQEPDAGVVRFEGVDVTKLSPEARAQRGLVRRFQDARLFPSLTVYETILVALEKHLDVRNPVFGAFALPHSRRAEKRVRARADRLIELLDLGAFRDKFVKELSTGLRRIVDLACVLAAEPRVLLLDEPSSGIAQAESEGLAPLLRRVRFETGCSILIIEHDMPLISAVSDELIALERGTFVTRGTPEEVLNDERVIESYLGTSEEAVKRSGSLN